VSYRILAGAGAARDCRAWWGLARFVLGRGGMLRGRWRAVAAYHRPDFHPWRYLDNRHLLSEFRDGIVDHTPGVQRGTGPSGCSGGGRTAGTLECG
jgi:predicted metal-dependent hydrolase